MNLYEELYNKAKDMSKEEILEYLKVKANFEDLPPYLIRIYGKNMDGKSIKKEFKSPSQIDWVIDDVALSILKTTPQLFINFYVSKFMKDKKGGISIRGKKLSNGTIATTLAYRYDIEHKEITIMIGLKKVAEIHIGQTFQPYKMADGTWANSDGKNFLSVSFRSPYQHNTSNISMSDITELTRGIKLKELLKLIGE